VLRGSAPTALAGDVRCPHCESPKVFDHVNGEFIVGVPQISQAPSEANQPLFTFRLWAEL